MPSPLVAAGVWWDRVRASDRLQTPACDDPAPSQAQTSASTPTPSLSAPPPAAVASGVVARQDRDSTPTRLSVVARPSRHLLGGAPRARCLTRAVVHKAALSKGIRHLPARFHLLQELLNFARPKRVHAGGNEPPIHHAQLLFIGLRHWHRRSLRRNLGACQETPELRDSTHLPQSSARFHPQTLHEVVDVPFSEVRHLVEVGDLRIRLLDFPQEIGRASC